jgi:hypothetical protein
MRSDSTCDFDYEFVDQLIESVDSRSQLSGIRMTYEANCMYKFSIDRIDSSMGYIKSNIRLTCLFENLAMNVWGDAALLTHPSVPLCVLPIDEAYKIMPNLNRESQREGPPGPRRNTIRLLTLLGYLNCAVKHRKTVGGRSKEIISTISTRDLIEVYYRQRGLDAIRQIPMLLRTGPFKISVDRIDSDGDYTRDNIQLLCDSTNRAKSHHSNADIATAFTKLYQSICSVPSDSHRIGQTEARLRKLVDQNPTNKALSTALGCSPSRARALRLLYDV